VKHARLADLLIEPPSKHRRRIRAAKRLGLLAVTALLLAYASWPYATLWRLDAAARSTDLRGLATLVDIHAVRGELKRKLNKERTSSIDRLSDPFIRWLEDGIQTLGSEAVDRLVTLEWVRERLRSPAPPATDGGFIGRVTRARFDGPTSFRLTIGAQDALPVQMRMRLRGTGWQVSTVYY
jgi:hypothetical protein